MSHVHAFPMHTYFLVNIFDLGHARHGRELGCLQEASPTVLNGFESETEKETVQSDLRGLCINK